MKKLLLAIQTKVIDFLGFSYWEKNVPFYQYKPHEFSIKGQDMDSLYDLLYKNLLKPGDIMLSRRDYCLTALPCFIEGDFKHVGLYVGKHDNKHTVIQATASGVTKEPVSNFWWADHIAIVRPLGLTDDEREKAANNAFKYLARPYDFDFRYTDHAELTCTELVGACYEEFKAKFKFNLVREKRFGATRTILYPDNIMLSNTSLIFISHSGHLFDVYHKKFLKTIGG